MTRILVDTNIILDLLAKRQPWHQESQQIFSLADLGKSKLIVSSLSIVNTHYVLKAVLKLKNARLIIRKFLILVEPFALNDKIIQLALNDDKFKDFEDGIQFHTAIESKCDLILTRNLKDFKKSTIPVMRPSEYLAQLDDKN